MAELLLDTNLLIDWFTDAPSAARLADILEKDRYRPAVAALTVVEFLVKARKTRPTFFER